MSSGRGLLGAILLACAGVVVGACNRTPQSPTPPIVPAGPRTLIGAGDIGQCGSPGPERTAQLLDRLAGTVFTAGDNAYYQGTPQQFRECYDPTWGRHKSRTYPSPGNHDYETPGAAGYFGYFGEVAAPSAPGYYTFTLGDWRIFSLNTNIPVDAGSAQVQWLRRELAAAPRCALVIMHEPPISSGPQGRNPHVFDLWRVLHEGGVDVVVTGDEHLYERFAPQDANLRADPSRGTRLFIVGTGGGDPYKFGAIAPNSEARGQDTWGVIRFTLTDGTYSWEFVPVDGATFRDFGSAVCS